MKKKKTVYPINKSIKNENVNMVMSIIRSGRVHSEKELDDLLQTWDLKGNMEDKDIRKINVLLLARGANPGISRGEKIKMMRKLGLPTKTKIDALATPKAIKKPVGPDRGIPKENWDSEVFDRLTSYGSGKVTANKKNTDYLKKGKNEGDVIRKAFIAKTISKKESDEKMHEEALRKKNARIGNWDQNALDRLARVPDRRKPKKKEEDEKHFEVPKKKIDWLHPSDTNASRARVRKIQEEIYNRHELAWETETIMSRSIEKNKNTPPRYLNIPVPQLKQEEKKSSFEVPKKKIDWLHPSDTNASLLRASKIEEEARKKEEARQEPVNVVLESIKKSKNYDLEGARKKYQDRVRAIANAETTDQRRFRLSQEEKARMPRRKTPEEVTAWLNSVIENRNNGLDRNR